MELICRILEQHPLRNSEYTDDKGQKRNINSKTFRLQSGPDIFYAEMTGEQATRNRQS